ncbi:hypothetical protein [Pedobacter heparinus]|uniref:hypothetical protein n=1 Tax=Pedobacter heparinus TaxID=984 RepID=UPI002931D468|nr:hypothetical protein [Pedobacter heparinus]
MQLIKKIVRLKIYVPALLLQTFLMVSFSLQAQPKQDIQVQVDARTGNYSVGSSSLNWTMSGSIGKALHQLKKEKGKDAIGAYTRISFQWESNNLYIGSIRWYTASPVVVFGLTTPKGADGQSLEAFPDFTRMPDSLNHFSYHNRIFPLAQYFLEETSTPWLFFNDKNDAAILSPASDFMVSLMTGDGTTHVRSGLNPEVQKLPAGFTHSSILVMRKGIRNTWDEWGAALRKTYHRKIPANDADVVLKYFGCWTDVGGDYYYNYDPAKGYDGTLLALKDHYKKEGIPLGYMQLDSWWYQKSTTNVHNVPSGKIKKPEFPEGPWNRSGGLMEYKADTALFPNGLAAFQQQLGLPLVTHNRWIDRASPYHKRFKISGIGAIDPGFWKEIMTYLKSSGVAVYEQDWINYIYTNNPEMKSDITVANAFTDNMAKAAHDVGISLQYCMGLPRYFMQGVKYNNLTTIRTAGDRFMPKRWMYFLFTSQLAYEMGIWPWSDVFKSAEMDNMIVSVLSAGPVGTGDLIGTENKANILMACRADGVLVKPDVPLLPLDQNYVQMARKEERPIVAATHTLHGKLKTGYVFAFGNDTTKINQFSFGLSELSMQGRSVVFNPQKHTVEVLEAGKRFSADLPEEKYAFYIVAPITTSGIAFLGDAGKITATGKKRITGISDAGKKLQVKVLFAKEESAVTLKGYSRQRVKSSKGKLSQDMANHLFTIVVSRPVKGDVETIILQTN